MIYGLGNDFLLTPKAQGIKEKVGKLAFIKIKNFCTSKDTIKKVKNQPVKQEKIFSNYVSDKGERERERQGRICHGRRDQKLGWGIHRILMGSSWGRALTDIPDPAL